jgi:lipid-binding SYLF domain-containing protein
MYDMSGTTIKVEFKFKREKTMRTNLSILLSLWVVMSLTGCSTPKGSTFTEQRSYANDMRDKTIAELYEKKPITKEKIANAAGYAVFSNININLFLISTGNGYGIAHDNKTGEDTYMKMGTIGAGLGLGARDFRAVMIFRTPESLETFVTEGWEWGANADAAAKSGEKGGAATAAGDIAGDIEIYQFVENGIALQATLAGTKYWKHPNLN